VRVLCARTRGIGRPWSLDHCISARAAGLDRSALESRADCSDEKRPLSDAWREIERRAEGKSKRAEARELHGGCASGFA
jgi:hypothetical protein